jgi:hypothetical protein
VPTSHHRRLVPTEQAATATHTYHCPRRDLHHHDIDIDDHHDNHAGLDFNLCRRRIDHYHLAGRIDQSSPDATATGAM